MILYYYPGACSLVPHIALEEIGEPYSLQKVDFATGEQLGSHYLAINAAGRVPALAVEQGVLTECPAILSYLAHRFPQAGLMAVDNDFEFARMQGFQLYIATTLQILFRQISRPEVFIDGEQEQAALKAKVPAMANQYYSLIEQRLADGRRWVHGEQFSASDIFLYVYASYLNIGDRGDPGKVPAIWAHRQRVRERPAVGRALQQEAEGMVPMSIFD